MKMSSHYLVDEALYLFLKEVTSPSPRDPICKVRRLANRSPFARCIEFRTQQPLLLDFLL
jgi:hypothetical protein